MQEVTYCEKCSEYVDYKRHWDIHNNSCDKCSKEKD